MRARRLPDHLSPVWEPLFNRAPKLEVVAEDARALTTQMASYSALLADAPLDEGECGQCMEAMQLCERIHGYAAVADALRYAVHCLSAAVLLVGMRASALAERYDCAVVGVLMGALIEEWAGEQGRLTAGRRFPELPWWSRPGSPHPLLDDCRVGVRLAWRIDPDAPDAPLACSALLAAARVARGEAEAGRLAERMMQAGGVRAAISEAGRAGLRLPPLWLHYAYRRTR